MKNVKHRLNEFNEFFGKIFPYLPGFLLKFFSLIIFLMYHFFISLDITRYFYLLDKFSKYNKKVYIKPEKRVLYLDDSYIHQHISEIFNQLREVQVLKWKRINRFTKNTMIYYIFNHLNPSIKVVHFGTIEILQYCNPKLLEKLKLKGVKLIGTCHHTLPDEETNLICSYFDEIITFSHYMKENLSKIGVKNINVIDLPDTYNENDKVDKSELKEELKIPNNKHIISFVGEIRGDKGIFFFLDSLNFLDSSTKEKIFINIAGRDMANMKNNISAQFTQSKIEHRINISNELLSLTDYLNNIYIADLFVLPYTRKGKNTSGSLFEAAYRRVPVLGPDNAEINYQITKWKIGLTFKHLDEMDLANKITFFVENYNTFNFDFDNFIENHTSKKFLQRVFDVYKRYI